MIKNRDYYDEFSSTYERERHRGYHVLLDELEVREALPACRDTDVLEVGCGTGLILKRLAPVARKAVGVDISLGMLRLAKERGLNVVQASAAELPFRDESFDTVVSFKVLAHVRDLPKALDEMARVTRPGGRLVLEFYNPCSLRYLAKRIRPGKITDSTKESDVFTRWDTIKDLRRVLPSSLSLEDVKGLRVFTPFAGLHRVPVLGSLLGWLERRAVASPFRYFGGFMVFHLVRRG